VECVVRLVPPHQVRGAGKSNPIHRNRETLWNQESGIRNQESGIRNQESDLDLPQRPQLVHHFVRNSSKSDGESCWAGVAVDGWIKFEI